MEKCPKCGRYSVAVDSYRRVKRCHIDGCMAHITENGYSFLRGGSNGNTVERVNKTLDGREEVLKTYNTG